MNWFLISRGRFLFVVGGLSVILVCVVARLHHWQVSSGSQLAVEARDSREGIRIEKARRGDIRDRQGAILATTRALITLGCDPTAVSLEDIAKPVVRKKKGQPDLTEPPLQDQLASVLGIKTPELRELLKPSPSGQRPVKWRIIRDSLSESDYAKVNSLKIKGIYGNRRYERATSIIHPDAA